MNKTSMIHIRVQPEVKHEVEEILNNLGMTTTEAINIYLKQIILNCGLPFKVTTPKFNDEMLESIAEANKIVKNPKNYKSYKNLAEIMEDIDNDETI